MLGHIGLFCQVGPWLWHVRRVGCTVRAFESLWYWHSVSFNVLRHLVGLPGWQNSFIKHLCPKYILTPIVWVQKGPKWLNVLGHVISLISPLFWVSGFDLFDLRCTHGPLTCLWSLPSNCMPTNITCQFVSGVWKWASILIVSVHVVSTFVSKHHVWFKNIGRPGHFKQVWHLGPPVPNWNLSS